MNFGQQPEKDHVFQTEEEQENTYLSGFIARLSYMVIGY